ncbi:hypothetical protein DVH24_014518 [Malus domestica]|uniref:Uncharacterized protein n=1 Tax=Malus domestica TaxID=3750 RepID=A0A498KQC6_MALDO|nr:hypothetical protein DVH24_014518 [Malus domestica]
MANLFFFAQFPQSPTCCSSQTFALAIPLVSSPLRIVDSYVGGFVQKIPHVTNLNMVEPMAARDGILWVVQWHWQQSFWSVTPYRWFKTLKGFSPTDILVEDIREGLRVFVESKVCHVCRSNVAAHCMAKLALSSNFNSCWFEEPPYSLSEVLLQDCMLS